MVPTARFMTIITPNCTSLMPKVRTMGRKIGVKISRAGAISIKVPTISRKMFRMSSRTYLLSEMPRTILLMAAGRPVKLSTKLRTEDAPMISMTTVVMFAV